MSVQELLKHARSLSQKQRKQLVRSVLAMDKAPAGIKKKPVKRRVKWPDILARANQVTGGRVLPNIILLEREERGF